MTTTSKYADEWQSAHDDVAEAGDVIVFTRDGPDYDADSDTPPDPESSSVSCVAIETRGRPATYDRLGMIESEAPSLFIVPDVIGLIPRVNATTTWAGNSVRVLDVDPVMPDGRQAIAAKIVIGR